MQREERVLDISLESVLQKVLDIKNSLQELLVKIEHHGEHSDWPQYLDAFSVISAQIFTLLKVLKNDKTPLLRNYLTLPLQLGAEPDEQLLRLTEQRVPAFSHDFVPNMLRTKPEPEVETKLHTLEQKQQQINSDLASKQINGHNKIVKHVMDLVNNAKDEWESETATRANQSQTCSQNETQFLVAAFNTGKDIKMLPRRAPPPGPSPTLSQAQTTTSKLVTAPGKAPSSIKTNIKAGNQMHPYSR